MANTALVATMPNVSVREFMTYVLSTPSANIGIWNFEVSAKIPARYKQPLFKTPEGDLSYELRMQRRTSGPGKPDVRTALAATTALLPRVFAVGGKIYPPYCPVLTKQQWHEQYGPQVWQRFAAAKKRFNPNNVLTPGAGVF